MNLHKGTTLIFYRAYTLYTDQPKYTGHVCITFGYGIKDQNGAYNTLVFNREPISYTVK